MLHGSLPHPIFILVFLAIAARIPATATETTVEAENTGSSVKKHDYPMWGGTSARVNAPDGKGIPLEWHFGEVLDRGWFEKPLSYRGIRPEGARNIKWVARLGSQTYGNPTVSNGRVFVGTNNGAGYLKRYPPRIDLGVLLCFEEKTGDFVWQHSNPKLPTGRVHDWPYQGVCSTPIVHGDRLWYVTNRGEVVCLDTQGFHDGEDDGPEQGTWVPLFNMHTSYRGQLAASRWVPERLSDAFAANGNVLPMRLYLRKGTRENVWLVGRSQRVSGGGYTWQSAYELQLLEGKLHVFRAGDNDQTQPSSRLFTVPDQELHFGLDRGVVSKSLREALAAFGVQLSERYSLITKQQGRAWSLTDGKAPAERIFRLRLKGQQVLSAEMLLTPAQKDEADVVWKVDMIGELGVSPHNMSNCSPLTVGNSLFICTSNGLDQHHVNLPKPDAPSFIAMDRDTGKVLWSSNLPGKNILHGQWASPSYGVFQGQPQVIFPGGDGWVYSFDPEGDGRGGAKLLWKFDGNPKTSKWMLGGRGTRNSIIAFPAIYDGLAYITMGHNPEHGEGEGSLWCIDPARRMDGSDVSAELAVDLDGKVIPHRRVQAVDLGEGERAIPNPASAVIWSYTKFDQNNDGEIDFEEEFHRSMGIPAIKDDILYIADFSGLFHCLDAKTGKVHWTHDMFAQCWGSALVVDGKVYIGDEDGEISVFRHSADPNVAMKEGLEPINIVDMANSVYMTPIVANNVLYIANTNTLFAIAVEDDQ